MKMRKIAIFFVLITAFFSCQKTVINKPDNLISEDEMVDILYDISLLEAIKVSNPASLDERKINVNSYIYKKYKIDSIQFAKSDKYYASDVEKYSKLYEKVSNRMEDAKNAADSLAVKGSNKK